MNKIEKLYASFHYLRLFFESFSNWRESSSDLGFPVTLTQLEYDYLFRGTDANIYVPLWASTSLSGMDVLLDNNTLNVIKEYKSNGYQPIGIDGNPPDYIGEQFRYLEYLYRFSMDNEAAEFINEYTLDTFRDMCRALDDCTSDPEISAIRNLASDALNGKGIDVSIDLFDSKKWLRNDSIPLEKPHEVFQSSYSDCGNKCRIRTTVQEGCVLSVDPDKNSEKRFSFCPRGAAYRKTFLSSKRLRYPMERIGDRFEGKFRRITWQEAESKVAEIIRKSHKDGFGSRYVIGGSGVLSVITGGDLTRRLLSADGGQLGHYGSYSFGGAVTVLPRMFGQLLIGNNESEMLNSKLLILWGNNLFTTHFGSEQKNYLMDAKLKGIPIIVIDPRRSNTAIALGAEWIPIRPGTDAALAAAMAYVIEKEGLCDKSFINRYCLGFDKDNMPEGVPFSESYLAYLKGEQDGVEKTPSWASSITGIPETTITSLAIRYAKAKYACIMPGLGPQRTLSGEQNYRAIMMLPALIGSYGKPGGGVIAWARPTGGKPVFPEKHNPYPMSIPQFFWQKAIDDPKSLTTELGLRGGERLESPVKYIFSIASGRLMNQHSDLNYTRKLLLDKEKIEAVVLSDIFMTPSARAADLILPAASFFETENINTPWSDEDYCLYNNKAIDPLFESKFELDWLSEVSRMLGIDESFLEGRTEMRDWLRDSWNSFRNMRPEVPSFEEFRKNGLAIINNPNPTVTFSDLLENDKPFRTQSGRIEILWKDLIGKEGLPSLPSYIPTEEGYEDSKNSKYPLQLIASHSKRLCHSIHDQNRLLEELERPSVWINKEDADQRGISDGDLVEVFNKRGSSRLPAFVTDRIMKGVIAMQEGYWYSPDKNGTDIRGSINVLTFSHKANPIGHSTPQHTNLADVRKF
ncbi:MAG: molybdopterin-dependent oxidoreductase [Spirochaetales bacterium]|nr:molybdopterin-dependent oxidoreductase [Spirochaetales bacterium]